MRLHQRVGRLNRHGQTRAVSVYLLRNPETVEARLWSLPEEKLARIQATLSASMEEAEDIAQLVIGMAGSSVFDELYSEGWLCCTNRCETASNNDPTRNHDKTLFLLYLSVIRRGHDRRLS